MCPLPVVMSCSTARVFLLCFSCIHQVVDQTVPACSSASLHRALEATGVPCQLLLLDGFAHIEAVVCATGRGQVTRSGTVLRSVVLQALGLQSARDAAVPSSLQAVSCRVCPGPSSAASLTGDCEAAAACPMAS